jgi:hypothetical protein
MMHLNSRRAIAWARLFACASLCSIASNSPAQDYTFELIPPGTYTYEELSDGIAADAYFGGNTTIWFDSEFIDQHFYVFDQDYFSPEDEVLMGENAFIEFKSSNDQVIIDAAFEYMSPLLPGDWRFYRIDGTPGQYILKTEWRNAHLDDGPPGNYLNVQIWFYQATGVVELHYGPRSTNNSSGYPLNAGPAAGMLWAPLDFSSIYGIAWLYGAPNSPTYDTAPPLGGFLTGIPTDGTVYRFTPTFTVPNAITEGEASVQLSAHPIPCNDQLRITGLQPAHGVYTATILDATGRTMITGAPLSPNGVLDTRELPSGAYVAHVRMDQSTATVRFIKM